MRRISSEKIAYDCLDLICSCSQINTTSHFLSYCLNYCCKRQTFFEKLNHIFSKTLQQSNFSATKDLFFGRQNLKDDKSTFYLHIYFYFCDGC